MAKTKKQNNQTERTTMANNSTNRESARYPREKMLVLFKDWFQTKPSIYPPNLENMVIHKAGKIGTET
jgi:hypothetical protein